MAFRISTLSTLLCLLSFSALGLSSQLVRRHEPEPFKLSEIIIDPTFKGQEISFYVSDQLSNLDSGTKHQTTGCLFSVPGITNDAANNNVKNFSVPWPQGDHLPCAVPSYSAAFVNLGPSEFALILYHAVIYQGQTSATLRYLSVNLPDINDWPNAYGNNKAVRYDIDITGFTVNERPAPAGWTGESYPKVSQ